MKIFLTMLVALMVSSCSYYHFPFQHHHHWKQGNDIPEGQESHNEIVIGGQLYVDEIIR